MLAPSPLPRSRTIVVTQSNLRLNLISSHRTGGQASQEKKEKQGKEKKNILPRNLRSMPRHSAMPAGPIKSRKSPYPGLPDLINQPNLTLAAFASRDLTYLTQLLLPIYLYIFILHSLYYTEYTVFLYSTLLSPITTYLITLLAQPSLLPARLRVLTDRPTNQPESYATITMLPLSLHLPLSSPFLSPSPSVFLSGLNRACSVVCIPSWHTCMYTLLRPLVCLFLLPPLPCSSLLFSTPLYSSLPYLSRSEQSRHVITFENDAI